jgi:uncharacterized membrane-anchored protein
MLRALMSRLTAEPVAAKVPEVTLLFWILKVLTTGTGEALSDALSHRSVPLDAVIGLGGFALTMVWQLRARRYHAVSYWSAVMMVAVFGTIVADGIHKGAGVPYAVSTAGFALIVAGVFAVWYRTEGTLSIHSILTSRRELFYWAAVLATFALGTAVGDVTAYTLNLGFLASTVVFAVAIAVPAVAWWRAWIHPVVAFWSAYVLTRPLGASMADWLGKPRSANGLGIGDATVSALALVVFAILVAYIARTRRDIQAPVPAPGPAQASISPRRIA